jgi:hypothetical protein
MRALQISIQARVQLIVDFFFANAMIELIWVSDARERPRVRIPGARSFRSDG